MANAGAVGASPTKFGLSTAAQQAAQGANLTWHECVPLIIGVGDPRLVTLQEHIECGKQFKEAAKNLTGGAPTVGKVPGVAGGNRTMLPRQQALVVAGGIIQWWIANNMPVTSISQYNRRKAERDQARQGEAAALAMSALAVQNRDAARAQCDVEQAKVITEIQAHIVTTAERDQAQADLDAALHKIEDLTESLKDMTTARDSLAEEVEALKVVLVVTDDPDSVSGGDGAAAAAQKPQ
eukprot:m.21891 g.21891  ORF g.21891 m.21891 type:complete len:238 (+) comp10581_c0_seq1:116-829(+)